MAVGARLCNEQARSDRDCGRKKRGRGAGKKADSGGLVAGYGLKCAVGPRLRKKKARFPAAENENRKYSTEKIKIKLTRDSGVAKTVARVFTLACANEHLLRNLESLVAVQ